MFRIIVVLGIFLFTTGISPAEWHMTNHGVCSPISISTDSTGNTILLGTSPGGYWITSDAGLNWTQINNRIIDSELLSLTSNYNIAIDPQADTLMINVMGIDPISSFDQYYSVDGGLSFSSLEATPDFPDSIRAWSSAPPALLLRNRPDQAYFLGLIDFAIYNQGIWSVINLHDVCRGVQGLYVKQERPDTVYAFGSWGESEGNHYGGIITSYDGGNHWTRLTHMEDITDEPGFITSVKEVSEDTLLALSVWYGLTTEHPPFLWSTDGGTSWEWIESTGLPWWTATNGFEICPEQSGHIYLSSATPVGIWESTDYCQSWHRVQRGLPNVPGAGSIYRNPYSNDLYAILDGQGVYRSTDSGNSWNPVSTPPFGVATYPQNGIIIDEGGVYQVTSAGELFFSYEHPDLFEQIQRPASDSDAFWVFPRTLKSDEMTITCKRQPFWQDEPSEYTSIWRSHDHGSTWSTDPEQEWNYGSSPVQIIEISDSILVSKTSYTEYMVTFDDGNTWQTHSTGFYITNLRALEDTLLLRAEYSPDDIMRSTDYGETWESLNFPNPDLLSLTNSSILDLDDTLYVCASAQVFAYFSPWGFWQPRGSFSASPATLSDVNWDVIAGSVDTLLICGDQSLHNLFISEDFGYTWYEQPIELTEDLHGEACWQLKYDKWRDRLWIDTGFGLAYMDDPTSSVGEDVWTFTPSNYIMLDSYPNPFNTTTTIRYSLQKPANIDLAVYDILGREVAKLASGRVSPGQHTTQFDGSNLSSGMYFLTLQAGEETIRRKLVLTK